MNNTLYITVGISGSGKSTWCKGQKVSVISTDEIRRRLLKDVNNQSRNKEVFEFAISSIQLLLKYRSVIFDATNCNLKYLKSLIKTFSEYNLVFVLFPTTIDVAFKRIQERVDGAMTPYETIIHQQKGYIEVVYYLTENEYKVILAKND